MEVTDIIKASRRLAKKIRLEDKMKYDIKVAVIGTTSIQYFVMVLRYLLDVEGIKADIYEGEYDGIAMDVMDSESALYKFAPEILIILSDYREIKNYPCILDSDTDVDTLLSTTFEIYKKLWGKLAALKDCYILQSNFVIPPENIYGNLERSLAYSQTCFLERFNERLVKERPMNVTIMDLDLLASNIGKWNWFDDTAYFMTKAGFRIDYIEKIVFLFVQQIKALRGQIKKCIVLDLDNTLWGGIVGDVGYDRIQLDPNHAVGEAYREFQKYLLLLKRRGVILAVVSKNDEENAKAPFWNNPHMILRLDDIASFKASWDDKVTNIKRVAEELNISTDSLVFFDDNPAEREIVKLYLPEVQVIDVPEDPALYKRALDNAFPFEWLQFTKEDLVRNDSYIENRHRIELQTQFVDYGEYLKSLNMRGNVRRPKSSEIPRFTQLLNKSNQFNLRTRRYSESEIIGIDKSTQKKCLSVLLQDKFSEYGIIACVILEKQNSECFIESWVMSCRVFKRGVEDLTFKAILRIAKAWGCNTLKGQYISSKKNSIVANFYDILGFEKIDEKDGVKNYTYVCNQKYEKEIFIEDAHI